MRLLQAEIYQQTNATWIETTGTTAGIRLVAFATGQNTVCLGVVGIDFGIVATGTF